MTTFKVGDIVCYTPDQITCTIIALYGADYKLQRHDNGKIFLSSRIVPGECGVSPPPPPPPPPPTPTPTFNIGDIVCYTPEQITCTIIAFYGVDYKLQRHDNGKMFLSSQIVPGACGASPPPTEITCNNPTTHRSSGCELLKWSDGNGDGVIATTNTASGQLARGEITQEEFNFIEKAVIAGSIDAICPGCYTTTPTPPPNMETRTMALTEGQHTIQISLSGYDTLNATINVSSTGVTCVSVTGGACGGTGLPRASTSGWAVTTYLKEGAAATNRCGWIASKDTSKVVFISEMVLAYNNLKNIGFTPTAAEIGNAVLMYSKLGTPDSLWGC